MQGAAFPDGNLAVCVCYVEGFEGERRKEREAEFTYCRYPGRDSLVYKGHIMLR